MYALLVLAILCLVIFMPWITIWALNTLFALGIAYTFKTWLAMLIVAMFVNGAKVKFNK